MNILKDFIAPIVVAGTIGFGSWGVGSALQARYASIEVTSVKTALAEESTIRAEADREHASDLKALFELRGEVTATTREMKALREDMKDLRDDLKTLRK